jgi:hypothetical protein
VEIEIRQVSRNLYGARLYNCERVYTYTDGYSSRESFTSPSPCK